MAELRLGNDVVIPQAYDPLRPFAVEVDAGKQLIANAINDKGGEASADESFSELAQDVRDMPTSGVLSNGIAQSAPFGFLEYVCKQDAYPFSEIEDDSVTVISRPNSFYQQTQLLKVKMTALRTISGSYTFNNCSALQSVYMPNLVTISGGGTFYNCTSLQEVNMPRLTFVTAGSVFRNTSQLKSISLPSLESVSGGSTNESLLVSSGVRYAYFPKLNTVSYAGLLRNCPVVDIQFGTLVQILDPLYDAKPNLRNITVGVDTNVNLDFHYWTATNVIAEGQSGIDELNSNLQTNLISKLYQGGGKILRLGAALYDVTTQETRDMVTAKGWTLQRG
jgi:hypothetical protein